MDVNDIRPDPSPAAPLGPAPRIREGEPGPDPRRDGTVGNRDRVEISDEGRSRAEEADASSDTGVPSGTLPVDVLVDIRRRIQARAHDSAEIIRSIARNIVERGDL